MHRKHIYCERKFLETCISAIENWKTENSSFRELELWLSIKSMVLSSDIVLHLDITLEEFEAIEHKRGKGLSGVEKQLLKIYEQQHTGKTHLKLSDKFVTLDAIDFAEKVQLTACYLTCLDSETCRQRMKEYGVIAINPETIMDFGLLLRDNGVAIKKNEEVDWNKALKPFPCNALILIDNYIFCDAKKAKENLEKIFASLLPIKLYSDIPFQIAIFTPLKTSDKKNDIEGQPWYNETAAMIGKLRPDLYFKLGIFKCKSDKFHDRTIITNNSYISCAGGFDLINSGKSSKTTIVNVVYPYFRGPINWASHAYSNLINEVSEVAERATTYKPNSEYLSGFYIGSKENRLFRDL